MRLLDKVQLSGQGVDKAPRPCMFYSTEGVQLDEPAAMFRFATEARVLVRQDDKLEALVSPAGMTANHHGREYRVIGLRHQYNPRGKCLYHVLQLRDVQG